MENAQGRLEKVQGGRGQAWLQAGEGYGLSLRLERLLKAPNVATQVALNPEEGANGMTAVYVPEGVAPPALVKALADRGACLASIVLPACSE